MVARNAQGRGDLARTEGGYTERDVKAPNSPDRTARKA